MIAGIFSGLTAASLASVSYICSRLFYGQTHKGALHLFAFSSIQMGVIAVLLLPCFWAGTAVLSLTFFLFAAGAAFFIMFGQISLFLTLKWSNPSQVVPLLSLKIVVLAFASILFLHEPVSLLQWLSVLLSVAATFTLHFSGEAIPLRALLGTLSTCTGYAFSDLLITLQLQNLQQAGLENPTMLGTCITYIITGITGAVALLFIQQEKTSWPVWKYSGYFALVWFIYMIFIFNTFRLIGPVFGVVLQSTRAIISILLAKFLGMRGAKDLEHNMDAGVLIRKLLAAVLFTCAIALYVLG